MIELDTIYNEDCLVGMKRIPDGSVDVIICDLPYGTTACKWDVVIPFDKLWEQYRRICKPSAAVVLFGSEPFSSFLRMSNLEWYRYDWIWHKNSSGGFVLAGKRPMKYHETISVFYSEQPVFHPQFQPYSHSTIARFKDGQKVNTSMVRTGNNIQGISHRYDNESIIEIKRGKNPESVLFFRSVPNSNGARLHPTQKPVELISYLVRTYTNKGDTVLDNCSGSGTTAVACVREGRHFICFEKDPTYWEKSVARLKREMMQPKLF